MSQAAATQGGLVGSVTAAVGAGTPGPRLTALSCSGVLALRAAPDALYLVGAGAHPVGGDETAVSLAIADDATARVTSVAATLARRGPVDEPSRHRVRVSVGARAAVEWTPEPGIAAAGCRHVAVTVVQMASTARLVLADEVVLGRHGEDPPGSWTTRTEVVLDGRPLLVSELGLGPASPSWLSSACFSGARALVSLVLVDPFAPEGTWQSATAEATGASGVALPLAGPGIELLAWGDELAAARALLGRLSDAACRSAWRARR